MVKQGVQSLKITVEEIEKFFRKRYKNLSNTEIVCKIQDIKRRDKKWIYFSKWFVKKNGLKGDERVIKKYARLCFTQYYANKPDIIGAFNTVSTNLDSHYSTQQNRRPTQKSQLHENNSNFR